MVGRKTFTSCPKLLRIIPLIKWIYCWWSLNSKSTNIRLPYMFKVFSYNCAALFCSGSMRPRRRNNGRWSDGYGFYVGGVFNNCLFLSVESPKQLGSQYHIMKACFRKVYLRSIVFVVYFCLMSFTKEILSDIGKF